MGSLQKMKMENIIHSSFCEKLVADTFELGNGEKHKAYILRGDGMFFLKDYGKTWALTKEELEDEKD